MLRSRRGTAARHHRPRVGSRLQLIATISCASATSRSRLWSVFKPSFCAHTYSISWCRYSHITLFRRVNGGFVTRPARRADRNLQLRNGKVHRRVTPSPARTGAMVITASATRAARCTRPPRGTPRSWPRADVFMKDTGSPGRSGSGEPTSSCVQNVPVQTHQHTSIKALLAAPTEL